MAEEDQEKNLCLVEGMEEVIEEADEGELLVLRRALSALKGYENEQREKPSTQSAWSKGRCALLLIVGVVPMSFFQAWWRS